MSETPVLVATGVSKSFGGVAALTDVDFEVMPGEVVGNLFLGHEWLVHGARRLADELDEPAMEQRTRELLKTLAVTTLSSPRSLVGSLSGGQRQAVAIARALLGRPKVVILDEPTAALGVIQTAHGAADRQPVAV